MEKIYSIRKSNSPRLGSNESSTLLAGDGEHFSIEFDADVLIDGKLEFARCIFKSDERLADDYRKLFRNAESLQVEGVARQGGNDHEMRVLSISRVLSWNHDFKLPKIPHPGEKNIQADNEKTPGF